MPQGTGSFVQHATRNGHRLTRLAPIHRRARATADTLQAAGLAGAILAIVAQGTNRVGGNDVTPPPSQGGPEHPGAAHDPPMVGALGPNRHAGAGQPHPLLSHSDDAVPVGRLSDDGIAPAARANAPPV